MSWSKDEKGKWNWTPDGKGNPAKTGDNVTPAAPKPTFAFGTNSSTGNQTNLGLLLGFGLKDKGKDVTLAPISIAPYVVTLSKSNPKAYNSIKGLVKAASGKTINDPNTLGAWVSRLAENIFYSQDPIVKTMSIEDFLRSTAKTANIADEAAKTAALPQREIYDKTEADRIAMLNKVSQDLRGQELTEEDRKTDWYKTLKSSVDKMIDAGSVRTVTKQLNPKTKKLESVATTVPGYSEEQVAATAEKAIRAATPEDVARKERVDFTSWMFKALGGANG
jgi:hypothetical protein